MEKGKLERVVSCIPDGIKTIGGYFKGNLDKSGKEIFDNSNGAISIAVKLFAKEAIDEYFKNKTKDKLKDFGINIYAKACLVQFSSSIPEIEKHIQGDESFLNFSEESILNINFEKLPEEDLVTIFNPVYHPLIRDFKKKSRLLLSHFGCTGPVIDSFIKHFNSNIEMTLQNAFGDEDYLKHKDEIKELLFENSEADILLDTLKQGKIGFKDDENLLYMDTYAEWKSVQTINHINPIDLNSISPRRGGYNEFIKKESNLKKAEKLIDQYFAKDDKSIDKILFAVADFGKGKSVFLKHYAARMAKEYISKGEGYFPIYFNLRNYSNYRHDTTLGVIDDFLQTEYGIKIDESNFKNRKYIFLIDSLDESGELNTQHIERVLNSVKAIQSLDKVECRDNRIIVTTRPFSDGLELQLKQHKPMILKDEHKKEVPHYLNIYGFKAKQFNHWLFHTLKNHSELSTLHPTGFAAEVINQAKNGKEVNTHKKLFENNTLSLEELKRPIFSYMVYQLIINNIDFTDIGKIGVYLSFINLLSRDAKHIDDNECQIELSEEVKYRNILHSIAALWTFERQFGQQGVLKKADICRVIDGKKNNSTDNEILEKYRENGVTEIQFLSHSYFGEQDNLLHFHHQSFAEILLAEYYLKVLLKYSLDEDDDIEGARSKLNLGLPTDQTIQFFKELLKLLKETVAEDITEKTLEKRKLLFPLFMSLSQKENNTLFSKDLFYDWYKRNKNDQELIINWALTSEKLEKLVKFLGEVIDDDNTLLVSSSRRLSCLFDHEVTSIPSPLLNDIPINIDKWLALIAGNVLFTNENEQKFFNSTLEKPTNLLEMLRGWSYIKSVAAPRWATDYFQGLILKGGGEKVQPNLSDFFVQASHELSLLNLSFFDFSYSEFNEVSFRHSKVNKAKFNNCTFNDCFFDYVPIVACNFKNIKSSGRLSFSGAYFFPGMLVPNKLVNCLSKHDFIMLQGVSTINVTEIERFFGFERFLKEDVFETIIDLSMLCIKQRKMSIDDVKSFFKFTGSGAAKCKQLYINYVDVKLNSTDV